MPALPPVPKVFEVRLHYTDGSDTNIQNQIFYQYTESVSKADATTLATNVANNWAANIAAQTGTWCTLIAVEINDLDSALGAHVQVGVTHAGTSNDTGKLGSGSALVMSNDEAFKYRGGHSRVYLPGQASQQLANSNTWSTAHQTTMNSLWNAFIQALVPSINPRVTVKKVESDTEQKKEEQKKMRQPAETSGAEKLMKPENAAGNTNNTGAANNSGLRGPPK